MANVLSDAQIRSYRDQGYLFPLRALAAGEARGLVERLEGIEAMETDRRALHQRRLRFKPHVLWPWLDAVVRHPRILDRVEDLIGPDILVWASAFFIKDARDPGYVAWHQDSITYGLDGDALVTAWIALTDAHLDNAAMRFIPESHRHGPLPHRDTADPNNVLSRGEAVDVAVDEARAVDVVLDAGEMSLHHIDLLHSSPPNASARRRIGYAIRYLPPWMTHRRGAASAMLVRGRDRCGHFELEPAPRAADEAAARAAHARAMELRLRAVFAGD